MVISTDGWVEGVEVFPVHRVTVEAMRGGERGGEGLPNGREACEGDEDGNLIPDGGDEMIRLIDLYL